MQNDGMNHRFVATFLIDLVDFRVIVATSWIIVVTFYAIVATIQFPPNSLLTRLIGLNLHS
ncbi:MAG TPA: hypothetical protein VI423_07220 [Paenisporosarcina sp.]|nr:hypothetical protein [Paenisporosarcina sp.]